MICRYAELSTTKGRLYQTSRATSCTLADIQMSIFELLQGRMDPDRGENWGNTACLYELHFFLSLNLPGMYLKNQYYSKHEKSKIPFSYMLYAYSVKRAYRGTKPLVVCTSFVYYLYLLVLVIFTNYIKI